MVCSPPRERTRAVAGGYGGWGYGGSYYATPGYYEENKTYYVESMNSFGCISPARLDVDVNVLAIPAATFTYNVSSQSGQFNTTFTDMRF